MSQSFRLVQLFALCVFFMGALEAKVATPDEGKPLGVYVGGFGGWGFSKVDVTQKGTAFLPASAGGTLYVDATGSSKDNSFGFGGLHLGYEWLDSWMLTPGVELEGYYYASTQKAADLVNDSVRLSHHDFSDTFPMRVGVILANFVLSYSNEYVIPYISPGIGVGITSIHNADSKQIKPLEAGINHFNSDPDASDSSFAVQGKVGLRFPIWKYVRPFIEYRFLYLCPLTYTFGSTQYPTHPETSDWDVKFTNFYHNLFSIGIDFTF